MKPTLYILAALMLVSGCAIKRPLIRPSEIPAYEQKQRDKLKEREDFLREQEQREQQEQQQQQPPASAPVVGS